MDLERLVEAHWSRYRAIRLRALVDSPDAFAKSLADEATFSPAKWRSRLSGGSATFVAAIDGTDVGVVTGADWRGRHGVAGLFGMWVAPESRGKGVGAALVCEVVDWAVAAGFERLCLDVADQNHAAIELYRRSGFEPTGATGALPPPRQHIAEHERAIALK